MPELTDTSLGVIRSLIPARVDCLPWLPFHTRMVVALGGAWVLNGLEITVARVIYPYATRVIAGMGIGGEYAAINSAIDEMNPARYRGRTDVAVNGTYSWARLGACRCGCGTSAAPCTAGHPAGQGSARHPGQS